MTVIFKPNGSLNIAADASSLPESGDGVTNIASEAVTRYKNLRTDLNGIAKTRDGSSKINSTRFVGATELVTNGDFASDISNWTDRSNGGGSIAWSAGTMLFSASAGFAIADQTITFPTANVEYRLTFDVSMSNNSTFDVMIGSTIGGSQYLSVYNYAVTTSVTLTFTPTSTTGYLRFLHRTHPVDVTLDNVSMMRSVEPVNLIVEQAGVRYAFAGNQIFRNESSIATGMTDAQSSAIRYNSFNDTTQQIFALNGTDQKRIEGANVYSWGSAAPGTPTTAVGSGTGLTGTYSAKITFCRKVGSTVVYETNPSGAGADRTLANQKLSVSWVASSDSQITHVRLYRTLNGGNVYYHDQDIAIGSTSIETSTADSALGSAVETDHDQPPTGGTIVVGPAYDGTCFIVKDNLLYYCKSKQPEYWPALYFIEVSNVQFPIKTAVFHNGQLYCLSKQDIYYIQGTGPGTFFPIKMNALTGAQGIFGALSVHGKGIFHVGPDGIYLFAGEDRKITEAALEPIFRGEDANGLPGISSLATAWLHQMGNGLYFGYASSGYTYPTNILKFNLDNGRLAYYTYNDGSVVPIRCVTNDLTNNRIIAGDTSGFLRVIEDKTVTTDSGAAIAYEARSKDFFLQTRRHFPRWIRYDIDASSATTCTGSVILDGTTIQSHTITGNRDTTKRLIATGNGKRCAISIAGTGPVSIYAAEFE